MGKDEGVGVAVMNSDEVAKVGLKVVCTIGVLVTVILRNEVKFGNALVEVKENSSVRAT